MPSTDWFEEAQRNPAELLDVMADAGTILVVDDELESLRLLTNVLQAEGYRVRPADSGELALRSVQEKLPDLILLDLRMPGLDGLEVCRRLKAKPETRDIPLMFLSASHEPNEKIEGLKLGAVDFISKPFQREELLARVHTHLELGRLRAQLEKLVAERTAELMIANRQLQLDLVERRLERTSRCRLEQVLFVLEVKIDCALGHARTFCHVFQPGCGETAPREFLHCGFDDFAGTLFLAALPN
jgi:DNA-binding response OmpR family regulator